MCASAVTENLASLNGSVMGVVVHIDSAPGPVISSPVSLLQDAIFDYGVGAVRTSYWIPSRVKYVETRNPHILTILQVESSEQFLVPVDNSSVQNFAFKRDVVVLRARLIADDYFFIICARMNKNPVPGNNYVGSMLYRSPRIGLRTIAGFIAPRSSYMIGVSIRRGIIITGAV